MEWWDDVGLCLLTALHIKKHGSLWLFWIKQSFCSEPYGRFSSIFSGIPTYTLQQLAACTNWELKATGDLPSGLSLHCGSHSAGLDLPCHKKAWNNTIALLLNQLWCYWLIQKGSLRGRNAIGSAFAKPLSLASHLLCYMPTTAHVAPEVQFAAKLQVAAVLAWHASHTSTFQG